MIGCRSSRIPNNHRILFLSVSIGSNLKEYNVSKCVPNPIATVYYCALSCVKDPCSSENRNSSNVLLVRKGRIIGKRNSGTFRLGLCRRIRKSAPEFPRKLNFLYFLATPSSLQSYIGYISIRGTTKGTHSISNLDVLKILDEHFLSQRTLSFTDEGTTDAPP